MNHLLGSLSQSSYIVSALVVVTMLMSGGALYFFWEKILGRWGIPH
jgi:hypothetical protein